MPWKRNRILAIARELPGMTGLGFREIISVQHHLILEARHMTASLAR